MKTMVERQTVMHMYRVNGYRRRYIARELHISRHTVDKILIEYELAINSQDADGSLNNLLTIQPQYDSSKRKPRRLTPDIIAEIDILLKKNQIKIILGLGKQCMLGKDIFMQLISQGYQVSYISVPQLLIQIREAKSAKTLKSRQIKFEKYDLVICDEFGYVSCDKEGGELLFNHLSLRSGKKATIITTNLARNKWGEIIKDKMFVTAMVDRLTYKAFLVNMNGQSYRLK